MLSQICPRNNNPHQTSFASGPTSLNTVSVAGSIPLSIKSRPATAKIRKRSPKQGKRTGDENSEDSHSHHSESSADDDSHTSLVSVKAGLSKCCIQGTIASRRWQMFQMIILPFIPIVALIIQNSTLLSNVVINLREAGEIKHQARSILSVPSFYF
jgi:hypothetical protein